MSFSKDAWNADQAERARREEERREKRVLDNWRRLVRGMLIATKIRAKYGNDDEKTEEAKVKKPKLFKTTKKSKA